MIGTDSLNTSENGYLGRNMVLNPIPHGQIRQLFFNRFYSDVSTYRNLHQHGGCSEKYHFCSVPPGM